MFITRNYDLPFPLHPPLYTCKELTSSLDCLLNSPASQTELSQCNSVPSTQSEEKAVTCQVIHKSISIDNTAPHFNSQLPSYTKHKHDPNHNCDHNNHPEPMYSSTSTVPRVRSNRIATKKHDTESNDNTDSYDNCESSQSHHQKTRISTNVSSETAMVHCYKKLVIALSIDCLNMSQILFAKEFIPRSISDKMLLFALTPQEKATILVNAVTDKIKLAPHRFQELIKIFSEQICTKDIADTLSTYIVSEEVAETCTTKEALMFSSSQQYALCEGHMYTAMMNFDSTDTIEVDQIEQKFALLCGKVKASFEQRHITPRTLALVLLNLTIHEDSSIKCSDTPLLKEKEEALMSAKSLDEIFSLLRPRMNFFNYELLQCLIGAKGSKDDNMALTAFLKNWNEFCKYHVFKVSFINSDYAVKQQKLHVRVSKPLPSTTMTECIPFTSDGGNVSPKFLRFSLEDAKKIIRKVAKILNLKAPSLLLDSISEGSIVLTILLPRGVSLTGLDHNAEIVSSGIHVLCGPPGKPELIELTSEGVGLQWSKPEYGCSSLKQYILYYQVKYKHETSTWQKLELSSLETYTFMSAVKNGGTYIFEIHTLSDAGTIQVSDKSDLIVFSADRILTKDIHKLIVANQEMLTSAFLSANPDKIAASLLASQVIKKEDHAQICASNEKATILISAIVKQLKVAPEKVQDFLSVAEQLLPSNTMDILQSKYYDYIYSQYMDYLKFLYASLNRGMSPNQWPLSATNTFFRLAMIKIFAAQTGEIVDDPQEKYSIQLENIFKESKGRRKVVLLEGAAGCGKSTISEYICQQWGKRELFHQFEFVILIQLRDQAVRNAKDLADLLPCPDSATARQIATRMLRNNCQGVLFILDEWDKLPQAIFRMLVKSELPQSSRLCQSSVVVTSRPILSGDLHPVVSLSVEILGFTPKTLHHFFKECLNGDAEAVKTLMQKIEGNSELLSSWYLPMDATILVHLFKSNCNTLPTTLYGIFSSLVVDYLKNHLTEHTKFKDVSLESIDKLPEYIKKPFSYLCELAYESKMENKTVFTSLRPAINTFNLLQVLESFMGREKTFSYKFIHLSIQELLAACYIVKILPASEQVSKINELFDKPRFRYVVQFYAAMTKLKNPEFSDVVVRVASKCSAHGYSIPKQNKSLLLTLLHCLYEAQNSYLCKSVALQLQCGMFLSCTTLTPSDCLCIGYFLSHVCKMTAGEFRVNLNHCSIGDQGCKYLVHGLHKYLDTHSAVCTLLTLNMSSNTISHHGVQYLSKLLEIGCVNDLNLFSNNPVSVEDILYTAIDTFSEQLKKNTTLKRLSLERCGLTSLNCESLAQTLTANKYLAELNISQNALDDNGIQYLAYALTDNQSLKRLDLVNCGMTDTGLKCLAKCLQDNVVLKKLKVYSYSNKDYQNKITENVVPVLTEYLQKVHTLTELCLPMSLRSSITTIEETVSNARKRNGLPFIEVLGMYPTLFTKWNIYRL